MISEMSKQNNQWSRGDSNSRPEDVPKALSTCLAFIVLSAARSNANLGCTKVPEIFVLSPGQ